MLQATLLIWTLLLLPANDAAEALTGFEPVGPFGGDVRSLAVHPQRPSRFFLGASDGSIYVSVDAATTWTRVSPGLGRRDLVVDNLVFHPDDPDVLYAACWELRSNRGRLFRTRDGGSSWRDVSPTEYRSAIRALAIAPSDPRVMALGITEGVLLSLDEGRTWDRITRGYRSLYNVESLAFDPLDSNTLYVGTWRLGWKTPNLGKKWVPMHQGMYFDSDMFSLLVNPARPSLLYASACTGVYRSTNAGEKWVKLKNGLPTEAKRTRTLHLDFTNPEVVYAGTTAGLYASRDGGDVWRRLIGDLVVNAVTTQPSNPQLVVVGADDAGILRSVDGGKTFEPANEGFVHRQISALAVDPHRPGGLYAAIPFDGAHGGFFAFAEGGAGWRSFNEGLGDVLGSIASILPSGSSRTVFLATSDGVFSGRPFEQPWSRISGTEGLRIADLVFADPQESILFAAAPEGVFRVDPAGPKVERLVIPIYDGPVNGLFRDSSSGGLFAAGDIGVFRSDDDGRTWEIKVRGLPPIPVNFVEKAGQTLFCGTRNGLYVSRDFGETWSRLESVYPLNIVALASDPEAPGRVYAMDSVGGFLFHSRDEGRAWTAIAPENRSRISQMVFAPSGELFAGTLSEGVYRLKPASTASETVTAGN